MIEGCRAKASTSTRKSEQQHIGVLERKREIVGGRKI